MFIQKSVSLTGILGSALLLCLLGSSPVSLRAQQTTDSSGPEAVSEARSQWLSWRAKQKNRDQIEPQVLFARWWQSRRNGAFTSSVHRSTQMEKTLDVFWRDWFSVGSTPQNQVSTLGRLTKAGNYQDFLSKALQDPELLTHLGNQTNFRTGYNPMIRSRSRTRFSFGIGGWSGGHGHSGVSGGVGVGFSPGNGKSSDGEAAESPFGPDSQAAKFLLESHLRQGSWGQTDLDAATLALTGWTSCEPRASRRMGEVVIGKRFHFLDEAHDSQEKIFLGQSLSGNGQAQGKNLLNQLAGTPEARLRLSHALTDHFRPGEHKNLRFNVEQIMTHENWSWDQVFFILIAE